jgi:hypothetical protein
VQFRVGAEFMGEESGGAAEGLFAGTVSPLRGGHPPLHGANGVHSDLPNLSRRKAPEVGKEYRAVALVKAGEDKAER